MEEKDIERCNQLIKVEHTNWIGINNQLAIKHLLENYKKDEKVIETMADSIELQQYSNIDTTNLKAICKELNCNKKCDLVNKNCIIDYFRKKCE